MSQQPWMPVKLHERFLQLNGKLHAIICYMKRDLQASCPGQPSKGTCTCGACKGDILCNVDVQATLMNPNYCQWSCDQEEQALQQGLIACSQ